MTDPSKPKHAPYRDVVRDEPVEIIVETRRDGDEPILVAEFTFRGDTFGSSLSLNDYDGERDALRLMSDIDRLVGDVATLAYQECFALPVFREEDETWTARVESSEPWLTAGARGSRGWVASFVDGTTPETAEAPPQREERDPVAASIGDADVSELRLSQDEMAALTRGEIPESLIARLLRARSTENLLDSAFASLDDFLDEPALARAREEIGEVRRRFG